MSPALRTQHFRTNQNLFLTFRMRKPLSIPFIDRSHLLPHNYWLIFCCCCQLFFLRFISFRLIVYSNNYFVTSYMMESVPIELFLLSDGLSVCLQNVWVCYHFYGSNAVSVFFFIMIVVVLLPYENFFLLPLLSNSVSSSISCFFASLLTRILVESTRKCNCILCPVSQWWFIVVWLFHFDGTRRVQIEQNHAMCA